MKKNKINFISFLMILNTLSVAIGEIFKCEIHPIKFKPGQFIEININNALHNNQELFVRIKTNNVYFTEQEMTNLSIISTQQNFLYRSSARQLI